MFNSFLFLHLVGLVVVAGSTFIDYFFYRSFWKQFVLDRGKGIVILQTIGAMPVFTAIGGVLLILSGVGMMILTRGVFDQFTWFRIKMIILILLILNIALIGRRNLKILRSAVIGTGESNPEGLLILKRNISGFQIAQMGFLVLIILLSVFKFN